MVEKTIQDNCNRGERLGFTLDTRAQEQSEGVRGGINRGGGVPATSGLGRLGTGLRTRPEWRRGLKEAVFVRSLSRPWSRQTAGLGSQDWLWGGRTQRDSPAEGQPPCFLRCPRWMGRRLCFFKVEVPSIMQAQPAARFVLYYFIMLF